MCSWFYSSQFLDFEVELLEETQQESGPATAVIATADTAVHIMKENEQIESET
jgi:hypothetical protein